MRILTTSAPALAIVLLLGAAACGSESGSDSGARAEEPETQLEITLWPQGRSAGGAQKVTVGCDPPAGTHPNPAEACEQLEALDDPFARPPIDELCTEQYGGPQEALIEGTFRGEPVSYALARTNGCEISRWEQLGFLLPAGAAA